MMLPAEKRLWVVEYKPVTCVKAGEMGEWYLHVGVKDGLGENWHRSALIGGRLVLKSALVSRRRQRKVVDKGTLFATAMISQGILARSLNNDALWRERWCPLGVLLGTVYSIP